MSLITNLCDIKFEAHLQKYGVCNVLNIRVDNKLLSETIACFLKQGNNEVQMCS